MHKGFTYLWLIVFACSLISAFGMSNEFHSETKSVEMSCCCTHLDDEACPKPCCSEGQNESDKNDCGGKCGNTSTHCSSISINIVALPNSNSICIKELIEYTFENPIYGYLESIPQPIAMPIWQPPKLV